LKLDTSDPNSKVTLLLGYISYLTPRGYYLCLA